MHFEELNQQIPADFSPESRAWVYQSSRRFTEQQQREIDEQLEQFYLQWTSHGSQVKGWAKLLFGQFIVVLADEQGDPLCGRSMDGMMRTIKSMEKQYDAQFFDRLTLTFWVKDSPQMLPLSQVEYALEKGYIHADTLFFNNAITTKAELLTQWMIPLKESWLASKLSVAL